MANSLSYEDVNPDSSNHKGNILYGADAVMLGSLRNLFMCPPYDRGRLHRPEYFSRLYSLLHEQVTEQTSWKVEASLRQSIGTWEPRIEIDSLTVMPDYNLPGYVIYVFGRLIVTNSPVSQAFSIPALI